MGSEECFVYCQFNAGEVMGKVNFTRVEDALTEGIRKMQMSKLWGQAKAAAEAAVLDSQKTPELLVKEDEGDKLKALAKMLVHLQRDLVRIHKWDENVYQKMGTSAEEMKLLVKRKEQLSVQERSKIQRIQAKVIRYAEKYNQSSSQLSDERLIEGERVAHINKRMNVRKTWLPLK